MTRSTKNPAKKDADTSQTTAPTKSDQVVDMLGKPDGVTLEQMCQVTGWQVHSSRAFMTGLKKKGHLIESDKVDGVRRYRITAMEPA